MKMPEIRREALQPFDHRNGRIGVHVADVQAEPQPRMVRRADNVQQILGLFLEHVFQHDVHAGVFAQKVLPEKGRLLRIPAGIVHLGIIAAVDDDLFRAVALCKGDRLTEAVRGKGSRARIDGAGEKLVERRVQRHTRDPRELFAHRRVRFRKILVHVAGGAVFRDLQPEGVLPRGTGSVGGDRRKIKTMVFHKLLRFSLFRGECFFSAAPREGFVIFLYYSLFPARIQCLLPIAL